MHVHLSSYQKRSSETHETIVIDGVDAGIELRASEKATTALDTGLSL